nr:retroviral aspartyl protease [Tanacetum cinerariifolium]
MQKRRAEGLCYNCPERYQPGHRCAPPQFLLLQSGNDPVPATKDPPWGLFIIPKFRFVNDDSSSDDNSSVPDEGRKLGDYEFEIPNVDFDVKKVSESTCMHGNDNVHESASKINRKETSHSNDPFGIYEILIGAKGDSNVIR